MARSKGFSSEDPVVVIGLGRFGSAVCESLLRLGHEVLAIEEDPELVQRYADDFTHVVRADSTDEDALRQLSVDSFQKAVVGIGTVEASVLTVLALRELGVKEVWAKALSPKHGQILRHVGAQHVIHPESTMGERVAHVVTGTMTDYIAFDDGFAIARTTAPVETLNKTLGESKPRGRHGVTVVGVKRPGEDFTYARPETPVSPGDELIISGPTKKVERFCGLT